MGEPFRLHVRVSFQLADHKALNILNQIPGGASNLRDCLGMSNMSYFPLCPFHVESSFGIGDLVKTFGSFQDHSNKILQLVEPGRESIDNKRLAAGQLKILDQETNYLKETLVSHGYSIPLLAQSSLMDTPGGDNPFDDVLNVPPAMHNIYHVCSGAMQMLLSSKNITKVCKERGISEFAAHIYRASTTMEQGVMKASFYGLRATTAKAVAWFEPEMLANEVSPFVCILYTSLFTPLEAHLLPQPIDSVASMQVPRIHICAMGNRQSPISSKRRSDY